MNENDQEEEINPFAEVIARIQAKKPPTYRDLAFQWLDMNRDQRIAAQLPTMQRDFSRSIGIGTTKMRQFKREFYALGLKGKIDKTLLQGDDIKNQPEEMKQKVIMALFEKTIKDKDHNAAYRLAQLMGWIIEKAEHKVQFELTAEDHLRIQREAERRISEVHRATERSSGMFPEPSLLLDKIRED